MQKRLESQQHDRAVSGVVRDEVSGVSTAGLFPERAGAGEEVGAESGALLRNMAPRVAQTEEGKVNSESTLKQRQFSQWQQSTRVIVI